MNMDDIELRLLIGCPVEIDSVGEIYSPLVEETIKLGQTKYSEYLSYLLIDKDRVNIEDSEKEKVTTFDVVISLCVHDSSFESNFLKALEFAFKEEAFLGHNDDELFFYFGDINEGRYVTKDNIELIQAVVRVANQVKVSEEEEDSYNPANEQARKIIEEMIARRKNKPKPKPTVNLHSIISGLACKSNSVNHFNVGRLSIYQLYDSFHRLEVIENYHYTLVGIYSGNVDGKKINYSKMHWTKILNQEN